MPSVALLPLLIALQAPAAAPIPPAGAAHAITQPDWISRPTARDLAELYPKAAAARRLEGQAVLRCGVEADGSLSGCSVSDESPPGEGFGDAALAMSSRFRMRPMTRDGAPVAGGRVNIPIRFGLPSAQPLTLETALECYGVLSANNLKLTDGQPAADGWRDAVQALAAREHLSAGEVEAQLNAARELAQTPAIEARTREQVIRCRAIRNSGALAALRQTPSAPSR
jgi:TonB family protein